MSRSLSEKYRPVTLAEVIGQPKAVKVIERLAADGIGGRAVWLSGSSGTGKTSLARIIAGMVAGPLAIEEINGAEMSVQDVRDMVQAMRTRCIPNGDDMRTGKAWIINEAHGLRPKVADELLTALEPAGGLPAHVIVICTTTSDNQDRLFEDYNDAPALFRRFLKLPLSRRDLCEPFAMRAMEIARAEGLDGQPIEAYRKLAKECRNSLGEMLSRIEAGAMLTE